MENLKKQEKILDKRGISHIEVILSFVIFLGFLVFLILIFKPSFISEKKDVYLNILEKEMKNYTSIEVGFQSLSLKETEKCFCFSYDYEKIIVKDENENFADALTLAKGKEKRACINDKKKFYYIYSSEEFNETGFDFSSCKELNEDKYSLGFFRSYNMISNNSLTKLKKEYDSEYYELKQKLKTEKDFSFSVRDTLGNKIINGERKLKEKTAGKNIPIEIVYANGEIKHAILNIQVW